MKEVKVGPNADRLRYYTAGAMHAVAVLCIAGWALGHAYDGLQPLFGPTGWLPVPVALVLVLIGVRLMTRGPRPT
jgi:hypothetical protein